MTLAYKFINAKYGLQALREKRLKISLINELNDPFELYPFRLENKKVRKVLERTREDLSKEFGLLCFSKKWTSPVQWAHYAENHQGICLGFEVPDSMLTSVLYIENRLAMPSKLTEDDAKTFTTTKFIHWQYEEELRLFVSLDEKADGIYYKDFADDLVLKKIFVGANSEITQTQINDALSNTSKEVEMWKVRPSFQHFTMVKQQNVALWKP